MIKDNLTMKEMKLKVKIMIQMRMVLRMIQLTRTKQKILQS